MKNLRGKVDAQGFYVAGGGVGTVELVALDQHKLIASQFEFISVDAVFQLAFGNPGNLQFIVPVNGMESEAAWMKFCVYMAMGNSSERNMLSSRSSSLVEMTNSIPAWLHFGNDALIKRSSFLKNTMIAFVIFYSTKLIKRIVSENRLV